MRSLHSFLFAVVFVAACDRATAPCNREQLAAVLEVNKSGPIYPGGRCVDSILVYLDACADTTWRSTRDHCSVYEPRA